MVRPSFCGLVIYSLLFGGFVSYSSAQCLSARELTVNLQKLSAQAYTDAQESALLTWKQRWERCQYPTDSTYINGQLQLGLTQLNLGKYAVATQVVKQAVQLSQAHRADVGPDQVSKALYRLGVLYSVQNQQDDALKILQEAIRQGRHIPLASKWVGNSHLYLAYAYYSSGDYQQALRHVERGEAIANSLNDTILLAKVWHEKAKGYNRLRQYKQARRAAEQSVRIAQSDKRLATILIMGYSLLGAIEENQQQTTKALYYQQQAFTTARDTKDPYAPNFAVQLGLYYHRLGRYDEAIPYFRFGVDHNTDPFDKANALSNLGTVFWKKKEFDTALSYYQQSLTTMPIGFRKITPESLPPAQAIRQVSQKDYLLSLIQDKADTWLDYAKATGNNRQRLQYALDTYKVADQMIDFMRWEHTQQESKLYWREKTRSMYERAIETSYLLGNAPQAFQLFEKSRAVMLADKLNELGARQQLTPRQAQEEQHLRQAVSEQQSELSKQLSVTSADYKRVKMNLEVKQDSLNDFLKRLEESNPVYYQYKYDNTTTSLPDLQDYLKKLPGSLVTYFVGDSALYVLGITSGGAVLRKQSIGPYTQALDQFAQLLGSPEALSTSSSVKRFLSVSNRLFRQLLAPLSLPKGRVIVSPDGFSIPFDALSRSATEHNYAVADYAFSYAYSASLLIKIGERKARMPDFPASEFVGVAPVTFAPSLKQVILPNSDQALTPIAGRFYSPVLLTHHLATRRAFLTQAADARIIHLFTHATADSSGQEPMLYFADSTLKLSDLADGALPNAQLVALVACKTGIGANQRGEGVFSLARGFAALGVPSVLTTLWSVQDRATSKLIQFFYKYLDEGFPKDIALQRAKQDWLKDADQSNQLPDRWAGLIIVGDTEPLVRTHVSLWISFGFLPFLAGLGGWFWRTQRRRSRRSVSSLHPV